jgi:prephenate dehydrogenase
MKTAAILGYGRFGRAFADFSRCAVYNVHVFDPFATVSAERTTASIADAIDGPTLLDIQS